METNILATLIIVINISTNWFPVATNRYGTILEAGVVSTNVNARITYAGDEYVFVLDETWDSNILSRQIITQPLPVPPSQADLRFLKPPVYFNSWKSELDTAAINPANAIR